MKSQLWQECKHRHCETDPVCLHCEYCSRHCTCPKEKDEQVNTSAGAAAAYAPCPTPATEPLAPGTTLTDAQRHEIQRQRRNEMAYSDDAVAKRNAKREAAAKLAAARAAEWQARLRGK